MPDFDQGMHDKTGYVEISCQEYEDALTPDLRVSSSLTDPDGVYGSPLVYTEWYDPVTDRPVLRSYLRGPRDGERTCDHWRAAG